MCWCELARVELYGLSAAGSSVLKRLSHEELDHLAEHAAKGGF